MTGTLLKLRADRRGVGRSPMKFSIKALKDPWRAMIAVNVAIMSALFAYKLLYHHPKTTYYHLIVDYKFGFAKRALIGELVSYMLPVTPVWFVFALGGAVWLVALILFLKLFSRAFGFSKETAPLFVFIFGSPFFLKNFIQTIGHFDIYGCMAALIVLLIPARSFLYIAAVAASCAVLLLIHPIHMLLYIPTILMIAVMRFNFTRGLTSVNGLAGGVLLLMLGGLFLQIAFNSPMPIPIDELMAHMRARSVGGAFLDPLVIDIWYRTISDDITRTWAEMPNHMRRVPVYLALIALHWPVIVYFRRLVLAVDGLWRRRLIALGVAGVTLGYVVMGMIIFDYARLLSGWGVCMFLIMHAVKMQAMRETAPLIEDSNQNRILGWIATALPRVGTVKPF